jgi:enoyl-CoA hydratase/carnithine racemase
VRVVRMASNPVNCINPAFLDQLDATLERLEGENASSQPSPVVFASTSGALSFFYFIFNNNYQFIIISLILFPAEKTYCAGLDLKTVLAMPRDELTHFIDRFVQSTLGCRLLPRWAR